MHGLIHQFQAVGKIVPGNARGPDGDVDPWPAEFRQLNDLEFFDLTVGQPQWFDPDQGHDLTHALAVRPHDVGTHPVDGDVFRNAALLLFVFGDQSGGQLFAHFIGRLGRDLFRVQGVKVAAGGQDVVPAPGDQSRWSRGDIASFKAVQQGIGLPGLTDTAVQVMNPVEDNRQRCQGCRIFQIISQKPGNLACDIVVFRCQQQSHAAFAETVDFLQQPAMAEAECLVDGALVFDQFGQVHIHGLANDFSERHAFSRVKTKNGMDEIHSPVSFRDPAEDMHAVLDLGVADSTQSLVGLFDGFIEIFLRLETDLVFQVGFFDEFDDHMFQGVGPAVVGQFGLLVFGQHPVQLLQIFVKTALLHHRLHMIHQGGAGPALGDRALRGVVGIVDVEMRQLVDGQIRQTGFGKADALAGQKLQVAVSADMDHHMGAEGIFQIAVGSEILMGRGNIRIMEDLADPAVAFGPGAATFRLDADHGVAVIDAGDEDGVFIDHRRRHAVDLLTGRFAPGLLHTRPGLFGKGMPPLMVVCQGNPSQRSAFVHDFIHRSPAELGDGLAVHDGVDQHLAALRRRHPVACRFHALENVGHALQGVEMGADPDRRFHRGAGVIMQDEGHLTFLDRNLGQADPTRHPRRQSVTAFDYCLAFFHRCAVLGIVAVFAAADDKRLDDSLELRQGHRPGNTGTDPLIICLPFLNGLIVGGDGSEDRDVQILQQLNAGGGVAAVAHILSGPAFQEERLELDQGVDAGRTGFGYKHVADHLTAAPGAQAFVAKTVGKDRDDV